MKNKKPDWYKQMVKEEREWILERINKLLTPTQKHLIRLFPILTLWQMIIRIEIHYINFWHNKRSRRVELWRNGKMIASRDRSF